MKKLLLVIALLGIFNFAFAASKTFYGKASWYGGKFHGRKTASGEAYDMNKLTCAHKTLPFGTILKVTNTDNGKSVQVKVTDRGPFVKGRVLDLSKKAAEDLGFIKTGVANIKAEVVGKKRDFDFQDEVINPKIKKKNASESESIDNIIKSLKKELGDRNNSDVKKVNPAKPAKVIPVAVVNKKVEKPSKEAKTYQIFVVQLGAFTSKSRALEFLGEVKKKGLEAYITVVGREDRTLYKVREKNIYRDINSVMIKVKELKKMGIECFAIGKFFVGS